MEVALTSNNKTSTADNVRHGVTVALLLAAGLLLRVQALPQESIWYDETASVQYLQAPDLMTYIQQVRSFDTPMTPVYFTLQYTWARLGFDSIVELRLLSVIISLLTAIAVYRLARKLFGPNAALLSLACVTLSNFHIYYGQEIRVYALVCLWAVLSIHMFILAIETGQKRWWCLNILLNGLLLWTQFLTAFLLVAQGVWLILFHPKRIRTTALWSAGHLPFLGLLVLWVMHIDHAGLSEAGGYMSAPTLKDFVRGISWGASLVPRPFYSGLIYLLTLVPPAILFAISLKRRTENEQGKQKFNRVGVLCCWLIIPPLCLFLFSYLKQPAFLLRYWIHASIAMYLLLSGAVALIPAQSLQKMTVYFFILLLAVQAIGEPRPFRPDWQSATRFIDRHYQPGDLVFKYPNWDTPTLNFLAPDLPVRTEGLDTYAPFIMELWNQTKEGKTVWVIFSRQGEDASLAAFDRSLIDRNLSFECHRIAGGSPTFVYLALARHTLRHQYTTAVYRITGPATSPN